LRPAPIKQRLADSLTDLELALIAGSTDPVSEFAAASTAVFRHDIHRASEVMAADSIEDSESDSAGLVFRPVFNLLAFNLTESNLTVLVLDTGLVTEATAIVIEAVAAFKSR
jgi:hypothetical protein